MTGPPGAPRTSRTQAALAVVGGLALAGVLVGGLWAWIAPPVHGVVALNRRGERVHDYLGNEADHFFLAAMLLLGLLSVLAVVASVLVWQWTAHRGPVMVAALSTGMAIAAALSAVVGAVAVHARYGIVDFAAAPVSADDPVYYFTEAPSVLLGHTPLQVAVALLLPTAAGALVYSVLAAASTRDDLGGYPVVDPPDNGSLSAVTAPGAPETSSAS